MRGIILSLLKLVKNLSFRGGLYSIFSMQTKFFKYKKQINEYIFVKVFSEHPDSAPECFKNSKLKRYDRIIIKKESNTSGACSKHTLMCTPEDLEENLKLYKAIEITEEEYNKVLTLFVDLMLKINDTINQINRM